MKKLRLKNNELALLQNEFIKTIQNMDIFESTIQISEPTQNEIIKPIINITPKAYCKMFELVRQSNVEISWHGLVTKDGNRYNIEDIIVFPQINTTASTNTQQEEYANWIMEKMLLDMDTFKKIRMHGHSHVNMNVFSSGVDQKYQSDLIKNIENDDYYIFLIVNKKHEIAVFLYDFKQQYMFRETDLAQPILLEDCNVWAEKQIENFCKNPEPTVYKEPKKGGKHGFKYQQRIL